MDDIAIIFVVMTALDVTLFALLVVVHVAIERRYRREQNEH